MNAYKQLKDHNQKTVNEFPMIFAFSNEQLEEGMKKLNVKDRSELIQMRAGSIIRKTDKQAFFDMLDLCDSNIRQGIESDPTGENFIKDMFTYELANHEYGYTYELDDTLQALNLTYDDIEKDERLKHGLKLAKKEVIENSVW